MGADHSINASDELWVCNLGMTPYRHANAFQDRIRARRQAGELPDTLLLLEHPSVFTRGRRATDRELPLSEDFYRSKGIEVLMTDRGGRVTYHGPGQLVGYPIMRIEDIQVYLRAIEASIVAALADAGVVARSRPTDGPDFTGVWVGERKIASIGVHVSRGVTTHGFAVNVANDLEPFSWIVACGLPDARMTSLARELGREHEADVACAHGLECFRRRMAHSFCQVHGRRQRLVSPRRLGIEAPLARAPARRAGVTA
jgi:lipoyl(octanoyl) transferase